MEEEFAGPEPLLHGVKTVGMQSVLLAPGGRSQAVAPGLKSGPQSAGGRRRHPARLYSLPENSR